MSQGLIIAILVQVFLLPWLFWKIFNKAGMSGLWALIAVIPAGALLLLIVLAVSDWPIEGKDEA